MARIGWIGDELKNEYKKAILLEMTWKTVIYFSGWTGLKWISEAGMSFVKPERVRKFIPALIEYERGVTNV